MIKIIKIISLHVMFYEYGDVREQSVKHTWN